MELYHLQPLISGNQSAMPTFDQLLGSAYADLPDAVRDFHEMRATHYVGTSFSGGKNSLIARLLRRAFGFPVIADKLSVDIWLDRKNGLDRWQRKFGERRFSSSFHAGKDGVLDERFGPFRFGFRLRAEQDRMYWDFVRWGLGPLPLPNFLGPKIFTYETQSKDDGFEFYSQADFPVIGRLVHYHGIVHPAKGQH